MRPSSDSISWNRWSDYNWITSICSVCTSIGTDSSSGPGRPVCRRRQALPSTLSASSALSIWADQAVAVDTSVNYSVGGSATPGQDYQELSGTVVMPAGSSQVSVGIRSLDDDEMDDNGVQA